MDALPVRKKDKVSARLGCSSKFVHLINTLLASASTQTQNPVNTYGTLQLFNFQRSKASSETIDFS
jgi:hypothetical protein